MNIPKHFELTEDGVRLTSLVLSATVFFPASMRAHADDLLAAWAAFRTWCPEQALRFYLTETMSEHKKVGKNTIGMLGAWLAPDAPERSIVSFEIKDGETVADTPHWMFDVLGIEGELEKPAIVQLAVPYSDDLAVAERLRRFTCALIARLDASHAVAGCAMLCSPYEEEASQTFAWGRSMRHRGVDILLREAERVTVGSDGIKGVNWLTFIDRSRVERLGGDAKLRSVLDAAVGVTPINDGLLLQAGPMPSFGDENREDHLPLYRNVFNAVQSLTVEAYERSLELVLEDMDDAEELSQRWRRRLAT